MKIDFANLQYQHKLYKDEIVAFVELIKIKKSK